MDPITIIALITGSGLVGYLAGRRAAHRLSILHDHILEALHESSGYGLQIGERIDARHGYRPSPGELYPMLRRMERDGELAVAKEPGCIERNYMPRYIYTLVDRPRSS